MILEKMLLHLTSSFEKHNFFFWSIRRFDSLRLDGSFLRCGFFRGGGRIFCHLNYYFRLGSLLACRGFFARRYFLSWSCLLSGSLLWRFFVSDLFRVRFSNLPLSRNLHAFEPCFDGFLASLHHDPRFETLKRHIRKLLAVERDHVLLVCVVIRRA